MNRFLRPFRRLHRDERGQDLLEFAFLMPFMLFLILVVVDFGIALDRQLIINHAAREASRLAAVGQTEANIRDRALDQAQGVLNGSATACPLTTNKACLDITWDDGIDTGTVAGQAGDPVAVRIRYRYDFINPFLAWLPFDSVVLGTCADSRLESQPTTSADRGWDCSS